MIGQAATTERYHSRRRINANDFEPRFGQMLRYGPSAATAEIKDHCLLREHLNKSIVPTLVVPRAVLTIAIPR
jgi:hypothetical protein